MAGVLALIGSWSSRLATVAHRHPIDFCLMRLDDATLLAAGGAVTDRLEDRTRTAPPTGLQMKTNEGKRVSHLQKKE